MVNFGIFKLVSFLDGMFVYAPLTPVVMVINRGLVFHPLFCIVLKRALYLVFLCEGFVRVFVVTICEFNTLDCECERGCYRCLCTMVWGSDYA